MIRRVLELEDSADRLTLTQDSGGDEDAVLVAQVSKAGSSTSRYVALDADQVEALIEFAQTELQRWHSGRRNKG